MADASDDEMLVLDDNCETTDSTGDRPRQDRPRQDRHSGFCYLYATFLSRFWYVICILVFVIVTTCAVVTFKVYDLPDFAEPKKGFQARGTVITSRAFSLRNVHRDSKDQLVSHPSDADNNQGNVPMSRELREVVGNPLDPADQSFGPTARSSVVDLTSTGIQFCSSIWNEDQYSVSSMVFEGVDGTNMLTTEAIKSVCKAEKRLVTSNPAYQSNCECYQGTSDCPTWSLGNYVALLANKTSCVDIEKEDVRRTTDLLVLCAHFYKNASLNDLLYSDLHDTLPDECIQHNCAAFAILHYLLPIAFSKNIDSQTTVSSPISEVLFPISSSDALETIFKESVDKKLNTDGVTRLKAVNFDIKFKLFSALLISDGVYMAVSAGAIFLLIWVYTGSLLVALAAFLNMIFSLVLADFCYTVVLARPFFPFGNIITVILMLGVGADDTFVYMDLWKKSKSEMGDRDIPGLVCETLRHASTTMTVTSLTTAAALYATVFSHITAMKCFAVFAGTGIVMNLVLTLTLLPAVVTMQHKVTKWCCSQKLCSQFCQSEVRCLKTLSQRVKIVYEDLIPFLVLKLRYLWIVLFLLLMTGGAVVVFYYPRFRLPSSAEFQLFVSSHYFEQYDFVYKEQFAFSQETFSDAGGSITWGVQAVDNGNIWDPDDEGTLVLDDGFKFSSPEDQAWLLNFCQDIKKQPFYRLGTMNCFIERFVAFMKNPRCEQFGINFSPCCNQSESTYSSSLFETCVAKLADLSPVNQPVFFRKTDSKLAVFNIDFATVYPSSYNFAKNEELWENVNPWIEDKLEAAPKSLQRGWFVGTFGGILFYDLQQSLATGTRNSMVITLAVASGILLLTMRNLLLTLLAMLTIASAVFVTVASLVLLGWELNIVEATIITLAVGLSVDFTIHYGVAYKLSSSDTRRKRTRYSLTTMTPAITLAASSTFLAGALVLPSTLLTYNRFAIFLMLVMSISWAHGTFLFQSLCMAIGPQGSCGDIPGLSKWGCSKRASGHVQREQEQTSLHAYDNPDESDAPLEEVDFIMDTDQAILLEQNHSLSY